MTDRQIEKGDRVKDERSGQYGTVIEVRTRRASWPIVLVKLDFVDAPRWLPVTRLEKK